jgi:hypothetical protein
MTDKPHTHKCQHCGTPVECHGELEPNHDGWPVVRCLTYHLDGGQVDTSFLCEYCRAAQQDAQA